MSIFDYSDMSQALFDMYKYWYKVCDAILNQSLSNT